MKYTVPLLTALASFAAADCGFSNLDAWGGRTYRVTAWGVPDVPGVCGGLWDNLKAFPWNCAVLADADCHAEGDGHTLKWTFTTWQACNEGMVESAWWEATQNKWGFQRCVK